MRKRSLALVAAIALLGGAAQVDARGGGFVSGGGFHGGAFHVGAPHGLPTLITTHGPGSIAPIPPHDGPLYAVAPTDRFGEHQVQHDFRRDGDFRREGDFRQDGDFRRDRDRFGARGASIGFSGSDTGFISRPSRRAIPVLYNYYYSAGGNYYSNVASDYGAPATTCPDGRQDNCQGY
jgi:hypothetical protein